MQLGQVLSVNLHERCQIYKIFEQTVKEIGIMFRSKKSDPPIAENLPPISGAIYWSNDIENNLALTLNREE